MDYILYTFLFLWYFWALYVLVMAFYRAHLSGRLVGLNKLLAVPFVVIGVAVDVFANLTIATLVFLELPRQWLVTQRLTYHIRRRQCRRRRWWRWRWWWWRWRWWWPDCWWRRRLEGQGVITHCPLTPNRAQVRLMAITANK